MRSRKFVLEKTALVATGQVLCCAVMMGVFALLGRLDHSVLLGSIVGGVIATLNFFFMAVTISLAADKAAAQNAPGGQATVRFSYISRMVMLFVLLYALIKSGLCDPLGAVLPLVFTRPILTIGNFLRKAEETHER